jgi:hypothetical protein
VEPALETTPARGPLGRRPAKPHARKSPHRRRRRSAYRLGTSIVRRFLAISRLSRCPWPSS